MRKVYVEIFPVGKGKFFGIVTDGNMAKSRYITAEHSDIQLVVKEARTSSKLLSWSLSDVKIMSKVKSQE